MNKQRDGEFVHFVLVGITKHWALKVWELDSGVATLRLTWMQFRQLDKYPAQIYSTVAGRNWNDLLHTSYKTTADWNLKANMILLIIYHKICCLFSPVEDAERQWQLDDCEPEPDPLGHVQLRLTGVDDVDNPEGDVHHQEEADHLPTWLPPELPRSVDKPEWYPWFSDFIE